MSLQAWMSAVSPYSEHDARAMCEPALVVAAGPTFDTFGKCPKMFDLTVEADGWDTKLKGLWQVIWSTLKKILCPCNQETGT